MVSAETCVKHCHKAAVCFYQQQHKPQGKGKGDGQVRNPMSPNILAKSDSEQTSWYTVTWPPNTVLASGQSVSHELITDSG